MIWPRVTEVLKDFGLIDVEWFKPKHSRRGRLVDAACNILGSGQQIDPEWWKRASGSSDPQADDWVPHEDCRPYIEAYQRFLAETGFRMTHCAIEVKNTAAGYIGHFDQLGLFERDALLDIKTGGESDWHRLQLGGYKPAVVETLKVVPARFNVYLTDDGKYRVVERKDQRDIQDYLVLAQAWHVLNRWRKN